MTTEVQLLTATPGLTVSNMAASTDYYHQILGFSVAYSNEAYAVMTRDGIALHLALDRDGDNNTGRGYCYLVVQGVDLLYQACCSKGAKIARPLEDSPYGMRDFNLSDPDGNTLLIGESIAK